MKRNTLSIGSVSEGTMLSSDLIDAFDSEMRNLCKRDAQKVRGMFPEVFAAIRQGDDIDGDDDLGIAASECVEAYFDALNERCPDYTYFGASEGDGASYGCWFSWDAIQDAVREGELFVADDSECNDPTELPKGYRGLWIRISDHGNAVLLRRDARGIDREID